MGNYKVIIGQTDYNEIVIVEFVSMLFHERCIKLYTKGLMSVDFNYPINRTITIYEKQWQELTDIKLKDYINKGREMFIDKEKAATLYEHCKSEWIENNFIVHFDKDNQLRDYTLKVGEELRLKIESKQFVSEYDYTLYTIEEDVCSEREDLVVEVAKIKLSSKMFYNLFKKLKPHIDKWFELQIFQPGNLNLHIIM